MRVNAPAYLPIWVALAVLTLAASAYVTTEGIVAALARLLVPCGTGGVGLWVGLALAGRRRTPARPASGSSGAKERTEEREGGTS